MSMYALEDLKELLCKELDEIAEKKELSAGDLETVQKLTSSIKNIHKIEMLEDGGYSRDGEWEADMRGTYGRGNSYARRGSHYVRGHYSRDSARDGMRRQLQDMLDSADDDTIRSAIQRCMDVLEDERG